MENEFKGRIIFSDNYQSTIDSIKLINSSNSNKATLTKQNKEFTDTSNKSDLSIIRGYEGITKIKRENFIRVCHRPPLCRVHSVHGF